MSVALSIGDRVSETDDLQHVGILQGIEGTRAYVRWHRGWATWVEMSDLIVIEPAIKQGGI